MTDDISEQPTIQSLAERAKSYFESAPERFTTINVTKKMAGFRLRNGRELALLRESEKPNLFVL